MRTAIYLRVSTGEQTTENQRIELSRVLTQRGWTLAGIYEDAGVSGKAGVSRPGLARLRTDAQERRFDLVMAWSVDRLGRSLQDLTALLAHIQACGVQLYLHKQQLDTTTPAGRALFGMLGVFAEFERELIVERVRAGKARAKAAGKPVGGQAPLPEPMRRRILAVASGNPDLSGHKIALLTGVSASTVARVLRAANRSSI